MSATNDAVKSVTDPGARKTEFVYDNRGRQIKTILPDNSETLTTYNPRGEVTGRSGSQTYPVTYTYDYAGRQETMTTYGAVQATTTWLYDPGTGFLVEKNYPGEDDDGVIDRDYTYTVAGRLLTRKWERGVTTTYGYDAGGRLASVTYSNETNGHTTPNLAYTYDALGRIDEVTRGGVLHAKHTYRTSDLQRLAEIQQIDSLNQAVTYTYEDGTNGTLQGRPNGFTFADGAATWSYDSSGRLATVSGGGLQPTGPFTYSYETGSAHLVDAVTGPEHTVTNEWEPTRDVLAFKQNDLPGGPLSKFAYSVNSLGQRIGLTPTGSAFANTTPFVWGYNPRGELTSATRNGLTAFERAYSYDGIGNRLTATDHTAATTSYFANTGATTAGGNALNQYAKINYPGSATIEPQHDIDGNLTSGPVPGPNGLNAGVPVSANATLTWDAENRLVEAVVGSVTIAYAYDHQSRLIAATVGGVTTRYLYDGWNRIAEYQQNGTGHELKRSYLWGMDMSGSMQGAGGLLAMTVHDTTTTTFYPTYDGNGNVSEYINQSGTDVAHFEYDPFGNLTVDRNGNANQFPYRFSTKPQDLTTGLLYYGYRWYDPVTGRWPSRDPIEERGGINLYGFVGNNSLNNADHLGLELVIIRVASIEELNQNSSNYQQLNEEVDSWENTFKQGAVELDQFIQKINAISDDDWKADDWKWAFNNGKSPDNHYNEKTGSIGADKSKIIEIAENEKKSRIVVLKSGGISEVEAKIREVASQMSGYGRIILSLHGQATMCYFPNTTQATHGDALQKFKTAAGNKSLEMITCGQAFAFKQELPGMSRNVKYEESMVLGVGIRFEVNEPDCKARLGTYRITRSYSLPEDISPPENFEIRKPDLLFE